MKKIILLLATFIISANAINCLEAVMYSQLTGDKMMINHRYYGIGYKIYKNDSLRYNETIYRNSVSIDSIHIYDDSYVSGAKEDFSYVPSDSMSYTENGNTGLAYEASTEKVKHYNVATFFADSVHVDSWYSYAINETRSEEATYTTDMFIKNDSLYIVTYDINDDPQSNESFLVMDKNDNNKCYAPSADNSSVTITLSSSGDTLILEENYGNETKYINYLLPINSDDITSITCKIKKATINKQYHYFDLMGRPAKGKNIIKVVK